MNDFIHGTVVKKQEKVNSAIKTIGIRLITADIFIFWKGVLAAILWPYFLGQYLSAILTN